MQNYITMERRVKLNKIHINIKRREKKRKEKLKKKKSERYSDIE